MPGSPSRDLVARRDATAPSGSRFQFIDALRGLAALAVAAYHISRYGPIAHAAEEATPAWLNEMLHHGWVGVQVFFVISGFVIAYSLRQVRATPSFIGQFIVRRCVRLDPAYWTTIGLALALATLAPSLVAEPAGNEDVSLGQFAAHFGYAQNVLGYENLSVGFWTLCIEVQFYLLFVVMLGLAQWSVAVSSDDELRLSYRRLAVLLAPLAIASLFYFGRQEATDAWLIHFFAMFFLGMLACWSLEGLVPRAAFWAFAGLMLVSLGVHWTLEITVALATGVAIHLVGQAGHLRDWFSYRPLQYLGRISYSLYLVHYPTSCLVAALGYELTGDAALPAVGWLIIALAASVGAAQILFVLIEGPSLQLARRITVFQSGKQKAESGTVALA